MFVSDRKTGIVSGSLILAFLLFSFPLAGAGAQAKTGVLTGHVYYQDGTSPVKGAVVQVKAADSEQVYESSPTDKQGSFRFDVLPEGLYAAGITFKGENYNVDNPIGVKTEEPVDVALIIGRDRPGPIWAFFTSTAGVAVLAAVTAGAAFAVVRARNRDQNRQGQEVSPFR